MSPPTAAVVPVSPQAQHSAFRRVVQSLLYMALWIAMLFVSAGTVHWTRGWICCILYGTAMVTMGAIVHRLNPGILAARTKWRHRDTKHFDKILLSIYLPLNIVQPVIGGLDVMRFRWSSMPPWTLFLGLVLFLLGVTVIGWTLAVNPWAEPSVRIQSDRGQRVVQAGPYRFVRHPMYVGMIIMDPGLACMLGSFWLMAVAGVIILILILRTALEDATLQRELAGYAEYAQGTRWRLVPGVW